MAFSQYTNFIEEECKEWPVQKCSVASELVKKFTPETKCHKEPKELCAPSGCGFVQGPEECYDKKETIIHDVSEMDRVSIQGVKSLWGDCVIFPRLGTGDTDRW